jgi:hypothetical protein
MKRIKPSDLRREAQRLIETGHMPSLEDLLTAIASARAKYVPQIKAARVEAQGRRRRTI